MLSMTQILKILVSLLMILVVLPISCSAVDAWTSKHTYGVGESIRLSIDLDHGETGYRVTVTDRDGRSSTFERYDLRSDRTYTIRMTASRTTGQRTVNVRAYDEDGDLTDRDTLHFHVTRAPVVVKRVGTEERESSGGSSNVY